MDNGVNVRAGTADADLLDGLVTLAAIFLTFLAFDDITTDNATSYRFEYTALVACGVWAIVLTIRLARRGRSTLAVACTSLLLALLWGQQKIEPGTIASWQPEYVAATAAFLGFVVVGLYLLASGARPARAPAR
jgi:hypothetical protein